MRLAIAVTAVLGLASMAAADPALAAVRKPTNITAQDLGAALQVFANDRDLQLVYATQEIADHRTSGAVGELSASEALTQLLEGTGLTYKYLDDKTITILPLATGDTEPAHTSAAPKDGSTTSAAKEAQKSFWDRFRLAQADSGKDVGNRAALTEESKESPAAVQLEEITVTAQKRKESLKDVPISISVLSGDQLDKSTVVGVTDALNTVPGVVAVAANQGSGTQIAVRGVAAAAQLSGGSSPIAYYLDTVPFGFVKATLAPDSNAYDLERIEVLRGPQGTLYGANAQGGVVRILTQDADLDEFHFKARTLASSTESGGGNYRADMAFNVPIVEGKLAARAVVGYENLSGWIDNKVANNVNDGELRNYRLKINAQPTDGLSVALSAWVTRDNYGGLSSSDDAGRRPSASLPEWIVSDYDAYGLRIGYEFPTFSISSMTSYLSYDSANQLDLSAAGLPRPETTALNADVFSEELLLNSTLSGSWQWSVGMFYRDDDDQNLFLIPALFLQDYQNRSKSYAAFGEVRWRFQSQWELTLGMRYFHDDVTTHDNNPANPPFEVNDTFNSTTPRVVLSWYPSSTLTAYASYSEGFRSGSPQNAGINVPATKPDLLHNYEVGLKTDAMNGRLSFDTAVYYIDWKDVQQLIGVPVGTFCCTSALVNGVGASGPGIDFEVAARPFDGLELRLTSSWNDLTFEDDVRSFNVVMFNKGDRLNLSSKYNGGASAEYSLGLGGGGYRAVFAASANYISRRSYRTVVAAVPRVATGDNWWVSRATFALVSPAHWTATLFGDNLNNENGAIGPGAYNTPEWSQRVRPRTIGVQFDYRF